jgi:hypothetical protein
MDNKSKINELDINNLYHRINVLLNISKELTSLMQESTVRINNLQEQITILNDRLEIKIKQDNLHQ